MVTFKYFFTNPIKKFVHDGGYTSIFRTIGFIGDSLSSGEHESFSNGEKGFHDYFEYSWGQFIARKCGLKAIIFSKGGLSCKEFFDYYIKEVKNPFTDENRCQAYVVALGVNDLNHLAEYYPEGFGSLEDVDWQNEDNNKQSFVGQYVRIIQKLKKFEPKCRIFVMSFPRECSLAKSRKDKGRLIIDFLLKLPLKFEYLYVLNIWKYAPTYGKKFKEKYFCGGHMNALGYKFTADMVMTYIDYYINKFPDDFKQVAFIGKGVHNEKEKW
ncbi:MAG: SGNH/GDSL hydrolase family protein [Bacilli bacterium]|nr:SGNH/GDSL hydrolase family protein [Bacilli bacterium]